MNELDNNVTLMNIANKTSEVATKLDSNFIPRGTIFNINADGTGDFPTINAAINYLKGKYSNGYIEINLSEGTHNIGNGFSIEGWELNIPYITIRGKGVNKTTITNNGKCISIASGVHLELNGINFVQTGSQSEGITVFRHSFCAVTNCNFTNYWYTLYSTGGSSVVLSGTISFYNCYVCLVAAAGTIHSDWGIKVIANNATNVCFAEYGGIISLYGDNDIQKTNVSQTDRTHRNGTISHK